MLDRVARDSYVAGDLSLVWGALTQADQVAGWFGDTAEIDLRVGGAVRFGWPAGEVSHGVVTRVDPLVTFTYRWDVFGTVREPQLFTTVEFRLTAVEGGAKVQVTESGLVALSAAGIAPDLDALHDEHVDGWRNEMNDLAAYVGSLTAAVQPSVREGGP